MDDDVLRRFPAIFKRKRGFTEKLLDRQDSSRLLSEAARSDEHERSAQDEAGDTWIRLGDAVAAAFSQIAEKRK